MATRETHGATNWTDKTWPSPRRRRHVYCERRYAVVSRCLTLSWLKASSQSSPAAAAANEHWPAELIGYSRSHVFWELIRVCLASIYWTVRMQIIFPSVYTRQGVEQIILSLSLSIPPARFTNCDWTSDCKSDNERFRGYVWLSTFAMRQSEFERIGFTLLYLLTWISAECNGVCRLFHSEQS